MSMDINSELPLLSALSMDPQNTFGKRISCISWVVKRDGVKLYHLPMTAPEVNGLTLQAKLRSPLFNLSAPAVKYPPPASNFRTLQYQVHFNGNNPVKFTKKADTCRH